MKDFRAPLANGAHADSTVKTTGVKHIFRLCLLIISFEKGDNEVKNSTNEYIKKNQCQFNDRNLKVIFFENYKNSNYQTPSYVNNKFGFWLVGYDGGVKLFSKEISILKNIFSTIDSMPMRKNEMSSKTSKCN